MINESGKNSTSTAIEQEPDSKSVRARTILWYLTFFGFMLNFVIRINLSIAIIGMIAKRHQNNAVNITTSECVAIDKSFNTTNEIIAETAGTVTFSIERWILDMFQSDYSGKNGFEWDEYVQSLLLGSFYWTYWITQIPGGILAQQYGTKLVFGLSNLIACLICFLLPMSAYLDYRFFITLRLVQGLLGGLTWPAMHTLTGKWIPPNERSKFVTSYQGSSVGVAIFLPLFGFVMSISSWEWIFHLNGILGIVWFICWQYFVYDSPAVHPRIQQSERTFIEQSLGSTVNKNLGSTPWKAILTSRTIWVIAIAHWSDSWSIFTSMTQAPTYFNLILGWSKELSGLPSGLPHLLRIVFGYLFAMFVDHLLWSNKLSRTNVRKLSGTVCFILNGLFYVGLAYSGCNSIAAVAFLTIAITMQGASSSTQLANIIDLSPNYSGVMLGFVLTLSTASGSVSAYVVGRLTLNNQTVEQWKYVFLITAGMLLFSGVVYILFCRSETKSWNSPTKGNREFAQQETITPKITENGDSSLSSYVVVNRYS